MKKSQGESGLAEFVRQYMDDSLQWSDVKWLTSITHLPVLLKGVITAEDAALTVEHGCAGIIVSNHGARQLDGVNATLEALPEIVAAVDGRVEVYLDGGVRSGADAFKVIPGALHWRPTSCGASVLTKCTRLPFRRSPSVPALSSWVDPCCGGSRTRVRMALTTSSSCCVTSSWRPCASLACPRLQRSGMVGSAGNQGLDCIRTLTHVVASVQAALPRRAHRSSC